MQHKRVYDILPDVRIDFQNYWESETQVTETLEGMGYVLHGSWYSSERDSFGPLARSIKVTAPDGDTFLVTYG